MIFEESFEVEKVVGKRMVNGKIEYRIKWTDYCAKDWIEIDKMNCDEKVKEYEMSLFNIIGAKMADAGMVYALKYHDSNIKMIASSELMTKYPEALVSFLEEQVEFSWPPRNALISNNNMFDNRSLYISASTNQGGHGIKYLLSQGDIQFLRVITSSIAVEYYPKAVIEFLESKLDLHDCNPLPDNKFYVTRGFNKRITNLGISLYPKVKIERSFSFEQHLLRAGSRGPVQLKKCKNVPIGARGRKRSTVVMFIGLTPNPDGRKMKASIPDNAAKSPGIKLNSGGHQMKTSMPANATGSPVRKPAKRTYARAASTPFPGGLRDSGGLRGRLLSFPIPELSPVSTTKDNGMPNDTLVKVQFAENFGRLNYNSSDSE